MEECLMKSSFIYEKTFAGHVFNFPFRWSHTAVTEAVWRYSQNHKKTSLQMEEGGFINYISLTAQTTSYVPPARKPRLASFK